MLVLQFGDITTSIAQVLVSSDDYYLTMGGGVSLALHRAGGNSIALDAAKKVPAKLADVVVTTAGNLPAEYIFHGITIGPQVQELSNRDVIRKIINRCMQLLDSFQLNSIAFPALGSGVAGFTLEEVAAEMAQCIADFLIKKKRAFEVTIYLYDRFGFRKKIDYINFFEVFASLATRIENYKVEEEPSEPKKDITPEPDYAKTAEEIKYQRINNIRKLMASLEDQRFKIEQKLIEALDDKTKVNKVDEIQRKLRENQELRLSYLTELKALSGKDIIDTPQISEKQKPLTIFVSSTSKDLAEHRAAIKDQIARRDLLFRGMEHFGASPSNLPPASVIVKEVRESDAYLGVFGVRYGYMDEATGLSMTELEFNEAEAGDKKMLLYVIKEDAPVKVSDIEPSPKGKAKLDALKSRILKNYVVYKFSSVEDLSRQVYEDLGKLK